jgi:hypothetical protein
MTQSRDYLSRVQEYKRGLENLLLDAQEGIDRQAPDVLDRMATTARNIARRLDAVASEARRRAAEREATPESPEGASHSPAQPPDQPPPASDGPGTTTEAG